MIGGETRCHYGAKMRMFKPVRLVYDKVSLGYGLDRIVHHASALISDVKPHTTAHEP